MRSPYLVALRCSAVILLPLLATPLVPAAPQAIQVVNHGLAVDYPLAAQPGRLAFLVREPSQGMLDLNGDADANDLVLHFYQSASGVTNLGVACGKQTMGTLTSMATATPVTTCSIRCSSTPTTAVTC